MLTFSQLPNNTQPKKIHQWRDLSERKPICRSGGFDERVRQSGGFVDAVWSGAIGAMRVGSLAIWCEWVQERWQDDLAGGCDDLSTLSSFSLCARGSEMARRSRWSVTGFDEGGFERSERCNHLAPMRSGCILAPTRRSSCSFSLSLSSVFQGRKSFEVKMKTEIIFHCFGYILWSTRKYFSVWPNLK